jgi:hypothetical protein
MVSEHSPVFGRLDGSSCYHISRRLPFGLRLVFHYIHHRYFECNYGTLGIPLDAWFGTFRDKLDYTDEMETKEIDSKATLSGIPDNIIFSLLGVVAPAVALWRCLEQGVESTLLFSVLIAAAPIVAAGVLHWRPSHNISIWKHYMFPFHNNSVYSHTLHVVIGGGLCCIIPVATLSMLLLEDPVDS